VSGRQLFYDWAREDPVQLTIRQLGAEGFHPDVYGPDQAAAQLRRMGALVRGPMHFWNEFYTVLLEVYGKRDGSDGERFMPRNAFNAVNAASRETGGGQSTNLYAGGIFELEPDQALIVESRIPVRAQYVGFHLGNLWGESLDFANHQSSLNGFQVEPDEDGVLRYVVAHRDPGVPNWLDTTGQREGFLTPRWSYSHTRRPISGRRSRRGSWPSTRSARSCRRASAASRPRNGASGSGSARSTSSAATDRSEERSPPSSRSADPPIPDRSGTTGRVGVRSALLALGVLLAASGASAAGMYQCRDAAGKVAFQDRTCATGLEATRLRAAESPPAAPAPAAVPLEPPPGPPPAPTRVPAGQRHVVVPAASDDPVWRGAFEQARRRRGVEVGAVGATLLRVFLEDARVGEDVQAVGTKLDDPADGGGGRYREIGSGGFVLVEHIARAGSQGHDQIELGALAHGVTRLPLTIPAPGSVAVLGDVVLARVRPEHAGHLEIHVESRACGWWSARSWWGVRSARWWTAMRRVSVPSVRSRRDR
jgi:hypothetical protein